MIRPISISLSPNTEPDDAWAAFKLYFQPKLWKKGREPELLEQEFSQYLGVAESISFNSGRSAFLALLNSLGFKNGDEILIQAFTCNAVPNPVMWAGLQPVYVDCNKEYNMDAEDLERKVSKKAKAVVVQHTFGRPADMEKIQEVCKRHNLVLLEDCAHALGAEYKGRKVGTFGIASFFSFSRDKAISCVYGGMAATSDKELAERVRVFQKKAGYPPYAWIKQQLLHPWMLNWFVLPTYGMFGKYLLIFAQYIHWLSKAVHKKEKKGKKPGYFPKALPNALASLARKQLGKIDRFNEHRRKTAEFYQKELAHTSFELLQDRDEGNMFLRFPVRHPSAHKIIKKAWGKNLLLGDWYTTPVAPHDTQIEKMGYRWGSCPAAESLSKNTLNLPTHIGIGEKETAAVVSFLKAHGD